MKSSSKHRSATIVGGSIAGLTAGLALLQRGWDVHIFEATRDDMSTRGAGIITHQILFDVLNSLGIVNSGDLGVSMHTRKTFAKDGSVVMSLPFEQIATSWGSIYQLLKTQFPIERYHSGVSVKSFQSMGDKVESIFTDGSRASSNLLIAADGIRSTIRPQLEPESTPQYVGYLAWRGLINEQDLSDSEKQELLPYFTFCLPDGEQVLSYPIAGELHKTERGQRRLNVVWYRPADSESTLMDMLTDINGDNNGLSIAPDKVRPSIVNQMRADTKRLLSPQHGLLMQKLIQPFIQPIYDLTTRSMAHENIAIVGDAAFTARPHLGVGITKAVQDAMALAQSLDCHDNIASALEQFNNNRCEINRALVNRSRELGAYLQAQMLSTAERQHAIKHRAIDAVMRETANLNY